MKKIIFSVMAAMVSMASMAALSDYDGTYSTSAATIYVPADNATGETYSMDITLKATAADRIQLSIKDFSYGDLVIGDIDVELAATETEEGVALSNVNVDGEDGPDAVTIGVPISTKIFVQGVSAIVKEDPNVLMLDLKIDGTIKSSGAPMNDVARVEVTDALYSETTSVKENTVLSVYPTVATSVINVPENGEFAIYSLAGSSVKSGVVSNGTVSVADLAAGNYVISVNGKNARFIKK